jgi:pimeloyl-ACP methyl ester carboxylesterase
MLPSRRWISCFASRYLRHAKDHPRTTTTLAFETVSAGELNGAAAVSSAGTRDQSSPLVGIILHGLLGSGRNWRSFARKVANSVTGSSSLPVQLHLLDLRNHGSSSKLQGIHPPHTMETAAQDIIHLVRHALGGQTPDLMIGHSLGGKVLLELLEQLQQEGLQQPKQAWVLDSQPGKVSADFDQPSGVARVIHTISSIPLPVPSRQWLYQHLQQQGFSAGISQWLGSNLVPDPDTGKLMWSFNIQVRQLCTLLRIFHCFVMHSVQCLPPSLPAAHCKLTRVQQSAFPFAFPFAPLRLNSGYLHIYCSSLSYLLLKVHGCVC